ncbi:MAG: radical SAM family heme chaperone HemW [Clostridiales bacterium]|nr:radical SAM family heme chaperone HemW [Clostridiales bacterium]
MSLKAGVYIHIPFCKARCHYCAFVSSTDFSVMKDYVSALRGEILSCGRGVKANVDTVYIGGGTPSCLYRGALTDIFKALVEAFDIDSGAEITVEANPESCTDEFIKEAVSCGVNRISMGLQSACDRTLKKIGRLHDVNGFIDAARLVRSHGITNVSSDIIIGLPDEGESDFKRAVNLVAEYCDHVSVYALTVEEGTELFRRGYKPDDDAVADLYEVACKTLYSLGYKRYEVSNFARNGKVSKHNSKYWRRAPYYGFGAGAHGFDGGKIRYYHSDSVKEYIQSAKVFKEILSDKDIYNEYVMLALRTETGIARDDFISRFGEAFRREFFERADVLNKQGLLLYENGFILIPPEKMFVMNSLIEELMLD